MAATNTKLSGAEFFRKYSDIIKEAEEKDDKKEEVKDDDSKDDEKDENGKKVMPWDKKKK
jgi:hypothetical protein